ncbi:MAG: ABC transporter substrate-binding protein [Opitutia bacterium]|jgi:ABC-type Fe3+ transport system substrate-binding protein
MTSSRPILVVGGLLALLVALPIALREDTVQAHDAGARRLVVLTPHGESIRKEFGEAFARHVKSARGEAVYVDWRSPGGTSEIRMVLDAGYKAAAEEGRAGVGMDIMFGGGVPDFASQARHGRLVPLRVFESQPSWFGPDAAIPPAFTGENFVAADRTWVASCLSQFGICLNPVAWENLGLQPARGWRDLGHPALAGKLALADPTKSGSVARSFELIVQAEIQRSLADPARAGLPEAERMALGWRDGLVLLQRMAANARYFTDNAGKIPQDVAHGNAVAGMSIDYYGRSYEEHLNRPGSTRIIWFAPARGTTVSADPIAVLKGAPEPELAQEFVEFVLSPAGQRLWHAQAGSAGGPLWRELHRPPVRRDLGLPKQGEPGGWADVYGAGEHLIYRPELTAKSFNSLRRIVRAMCIDTHDELREAWLAIIEAGMPPEALAALTDMSALAYRPGGAGDPLLDNADPLVVARRMRELAEGFRANYLRAAEIARRTPAETR